jgi:hypothetical protein
MNNNDIQLIIDFRNFPQYHFNAGDPQSLGYIIGHGFGFPGAAVIGDKSFFHETSSGGWMVDDRSPEIRYLFPVWA